MFGACCRLRRAQTLEWWQLGLCLTGSNTLRNSEVMRAICIICACGGSAFRATFRVLLCLGLQLWHNFSQKKNNNVGHVTQCAARNHLMHGARCGRTKGRRDSKIKEEIHSMHTTLIGRTSLQTVNNIHNNNSNNNPGCKRVLWMFL